MCKVRILEGFFFFYCSSALVSLGSLWMFRDHIQTYHTRQDFSVESQIRCRELYMTIQHSRETDNHALGGIRTLKRAAADPRLRPRGHRDWL